MKNKTQKWAFAAIKAATTELRFSVLRVDSGHADLAAGFIPGRGER